MRVKTSLVTCLTLLLGCQYDPFAHEFTETEPRRAAVAGEYKPDRETTERLRSSLGVSVNPAAKFVLNQDGTFVANELPNCWIAQSFDCAPGTETWAGTWSLRRNQDWWAVQLHLTSRNGQATTYGLPAMLRREEPPYLLHLTIGDPDSGDALAFERR